jgi:PAS domain S-box-containing protein
VIRPDSDLVAIATGAPSSPSDAGRSESERLAELSPALLAVVDSDGTMLFANGAWERLLGWDIEELVQQPAGDLLHEQEREELAAKFAVARAQPGTELFFVGRTAARDGSWRWIDWRIRFDSDRWYCAGQLASESGRARSQRLESESQLTAAQRAAGVGSFEIDLETHDVVWSDEMYKIFGVKPGEVELNVDFTIGLTHPDDQERLTVYWEQQINDPSPAWAEFRIQRHDGAERILTARVEVDGDRPRKLVGIVQDITERRRAQQALEASERRYRALVEQVPAAVYTAGVGPEAGWDFVSPHIERMLGYPAHEWTSNKSQWYSVVHPEDRDRVLAGEAQLRNVGDQLGIDYRMFSTDGRLVHVHDEATLIENDRGELRLQGVLIDVTDRQEAEAALSESEERYRRIVETSHDLIWEVDSEGRFTFVNDAVRYTHGFEPEEMIGRRFTEFHGELPLEGSYETEHVRKDGATVDLAFSAAAIRDADGELLSVIGTARDITIAKRHEAEIKAQHQQLQAIIDNSPMVVFAKDRDLKYLFVNQEVAELFGMEPEAIIGQGDEAILPAEAIETMRANDRQVLETGQAIEVEEVVPKPGGDRTFMVHKFPLRGSEGEIRGVAGIAIDITERKAREDEMRSKVEWSFRIRQAIADDRLVLHAQPIVDIASGQRVQDELLVRMVGEDGGDLIMPNEFLPPAERFGLAPAIDRWVVARAARLARDQRVEVNLSAHSLGDKSLTAFIESELEASGADPSNLVFEITETAAASDLVQAGKLADRLIALGCGFALDDFGTGYGSFTYLKHLPVGYIKIDMQFVSNLVTDASDRQVVKAIVDVARNFEIKTIAEGVETEATLEQLRKLGVDYAQGYHVGRPAPIEGF